MFLVRFKHRRWAEVIIFLHILMTVALTEEKSLVGHFKVFGCLCYTHVNKDKIEKFDTKARSCIMLGYGTETKVYRL